MADEETKGKSCLIHLKGVKEEINTFTEQTFTKLKNCRLQWLQLPGSSSEITHESLKICANEELDFSKYYFHKYCYRQFTDVTKIRRAESKQQKLLAVEQSEINQCKVATASINPRKRTRSAIISPLVEIPARNNEVLPNVCIICKKEKIYVKDKVSIWEYRNYSLICHPVYLYCMALYKNCI